MNTRVDTRPTMAGQVEVEVTYVIRHVVPVLHYVNPDEPDEPTGREIVEIEEGNARQYGHFADADEMEIEVVARWVDHNGTRRIARSTRGAQDMDRDDAEWLVANEEE